MVGESFKMISYVERKVIYSGGSELLAVLFENGGYIVMGRVTLE
jgi:hypothetical protein